MAPGSPRSPAEIPLFLVKLKSAANVTVGLVCISPIERIDQFVRHAGGEGIHALGSVERERQNAVGDLIT